MAPGLEVSSRWGLLPFAVVLAAIGAMRFGAVMLPSEAPRHRALLGATAAAAAIAVGTRLAGAAGVLGQDSLFAVLLAVTVVFLVIGRERQLGIAWRELVSRETAPLVVVACAGLAITAAAAHYLPIWQWDSLGYHLPYVDFALQRGTLADVPDDVPYISTYPHAVELLFIAWRGMLPDDRLVDAAQIPLGILGAGAIAVIAREHGARADVASAAGLAWLSLPAVFLQLPTNYVDVGSTSFLLASIAFALSEPTAPKVVGAGLALGLFLGSKPSAPVGTALVFALVAWRAWRAGHRTAILAGAACVLLLGAESYVVNLVRHANPIWPVRVVLGSWTLPGTLPMQELLDSGPLAPRLHGPLPLRLLRSWLTLDGPFMFDMRYGGLGLLHLAALPAAAVVAWRRRSIAIALVALAALASPDPAVPRYVLAFPGLVLALAAAQLGALSGRGRRIAFALAALVAAHGLARAYPALTGEGPPLTDYASMSEADRLRAVGANGRSAAFYDALERTGPGEVTAFDASFDLPYLAWPPDLSRRAMRLRDDLGQGDVDRIVRDRNIRLLIVNRASPLAAAMRGQQDTFTPLFDCRSTACTVFFRN